MGRAHRTTAHRATAATLLAVVLGLAAPGGGLAAAVPEAAPETTPGAIPGSASEEKVPQGVWPLAGDPEVIRGFEPPELRWARGHRGVDLAGAPAQPVVASLAGRVSFAGSIAGRGVVVVQHGGTRTTYEPVLAEVGVGDAVGRGERLGWLQAGGSHCAPLVCLHWGWRRGELYLDPLDLVGGTGVRLLPLWSDVPAPGPLRPWAATTPPAEVPAAPGSLSAPPVPARGPWWPLMPWGVPDGRPS